MPHDPSQSSRRRFLIRAGSAVTALAAGGAGAREEPALPLIGYNEYRANLPGGRLPNVETMRAHVVRADGTGRREVGAGLANEPHSWTQFAGWSPEGRTAIVGRGWESPENAAWEEEHKGFRFGDGWLYDVHLVDLRSGKSTNVTAVDRVSRYNSGVFFWPNDPKRLGFTALIDGVSHPYSMDVDGRNKKDLTDGKSEFTYGFSAAPDGKRVSYHKNYQVYLADTDGANARHVQTGNPFNFAPTWSPDGEWVLFVSGEHQNCHPHVVRRDGTGLRKLADRNGYKGWIAFLDVPDFHDGSSDIPAWSRDGRWVYYTAAVGGSVELMRVSVEGKSEQLTHSAPGVLQYHPVPSPDGRRLCFGSNRTGTRQLYVCGLDGADAHPITRVPPGSGAMWAYWQPAPLVRSK